jgi:hypothetical protein
MFKAADETKLAAPKKDLTTRYRNLLQNVARRAPASVVAAKIAHGAYLDAIRRVNEARLDRVALKIAAAKEISALIPEIGAVRPGATKAKKEIEDLHKLLALPLYEQEKLARESEQSAIQRLVMLEKQLKTMSLVSKSLPGYSFEQLVARAGLSTTLVFPKAASNEITVASKPVAPPAPPAIILEQPAEPARISPDRTSETQAAVLMPATIIAPATPAQTPARAESKQTTPSPQPKRTITPDIQQKAPVQSLPPIRMAPIFPRRGDILTTKTALPSVPSKAPAPVKTEPKNPAAFHAKAQLQTTPSSTHVTKTRLSTSNSKSVQPPAQAPTKAALPTTKAQAPASQAGRVTRIALPSSTSKAPRSKIKNTAADSASNQALPQTLSLAEMRFPKDSSSAPNPKNFSSDNGAPRPTPVLPSASVSSQASDEEARKAKQRRDKRRAIFITIRSRKPRDSYGR